MRFIFVIALLATSPAVAAPNRAALTQAGNDLLYCVSRQVGMHVNVVRQQWPNRDDLYSKGKSTLTVLSISTCANYYRAMARQMGITESDFLQSRTFKLLLSHTDKQIVSAFIEADLLAEGNQLARQSGNDVQAAINRLQELEQQRQAEADAEVMQ